MSDLDDTIAKLRALPEAEKDAVAAQIELLLDGASEDLLTPQQWAEVESRLDQSESFASHEAVVKTFRSRFPG